MGVITDKQWERITDLWLSDDYSPVEIMDETSIDLDSIEVTIRRIEYVHKITRRIMLAAIRDALGTDLEG